MKNLEKIRIMMVVIMKMFEIRDNGIELNNHQLSIEDIVNLDVPIFNDPILSNDRIVINSRSQSNIVDLDYDIYQESSNFLQINSDF